MCTEYTISTSIVRDVDCSHRAHYSAGTLFGMHRVVVAILAIVLGSAAAPAAAAPPPLGTVEVSPSMAACGKTGAVDHVRCGAAFTARWLAHRRTPDVVARTVIQQPVTVGAWRSGTTGALCGYTNVRPIRFGMHHCDRTTFVVPSLDGAVLASDVTTITALAHESGHGVQERRGYDPVTVTLLGESDRLFPLEQHADCWAGAAMSWYTAQSMLPASAPAQARTLMRELGSRDAGHGTSVQRLAAFDAGFTHGATSCDRLLR